MSNGISRTDGIASGTQTNKSTETGGVTAGRRKVKESKKQKMFIEKKSKQVSKSISKNISSRDGAKTKKTKTKDDLPPTEARFDESILDDLSASFARFFEVDELSNPSNSKDKADVLKNLASLYFVQNADDEGHEHNKNLMNTAVRSILDMKQNIDIYNNYKGSEKHLNNMIKSIVEGAKEALKYIEEDQLENFIDKVNILMHGDHFQDHFKKSGISNQIVDKVKNLVEESTIAIFSKYFHNKDNPLKPALYNKISDFISFLDPKSEKVMDKLNQSIIKKQQKLDKANKKKETILEKQKALIKKSLASISGVKIAFNTKEKALKKLEEEYKKRPKSPKKLIDFLYIKIQRLLTSRLEIKAEKMYQDIVSQTKKYSTLGGDQESIQGLTEVIASASTYYDEEETRGR